MKNKILYISACLRDDSRTKELSRHLLDRLGGEITEIDLYKENILPLDGKALEKRNLNDHSGEEFKYAKQFKDADTIVIAAPFWDLSFPSVLKIYLENILVSGITFEYSQDGRPIGKCNAKKLYYITTSGGYIEKNNFGFDYVKSIAEKFLTIDDIYFYSAEGLDILGSDTKAILNEAKKKIENELC